MNTDTFKAVKVAVSTQTSLLLVVYIDFQTVLKKWYESSSQKGDPRCHINGTNVRFFFFQFNYLQINGLNAKRKKMKLYTSRINAVCVYHSDIAFYNLLAWENKQCLSPLHSPESCQYKPYTVTITDNGYSLQHWQVSVTTVN